MFCWEASTTPMSRVNGRKIKLTPQVNMEVMKIDGVNLLNYCSKRFLLTVVIVL